MILLSVLLAVRKLPYDETLEESKDAHVVIFTDPFVDGAPKVIETVQNALKDIKIDIIYMDCDVQYSKCSAYGMLRPLDVVFYNRGRPIRYPFELTEDGIRTFIKRWMLREEGKYKEVLAEVQGTAYASFASSDMTTCLKLQFKWPTFLIQCIKVEDEAEKTLSIHWANTTVQKYPLDSLTENQVELIVLTTLRQRLTLFVDVRQLISTRQNYGAIIFTSDDYYKDISRFVKSNELKEDVFVIQSANLLKLTPIHFKYNDLDIIYCYEINEQSNGYQHYKIDPQNFDEDVRDTLKRIEDVRETVKRNRNAGLTQRGVDYLEKRAFTYVMSTIAFRCIDRPVRFVKRVIAQYRAGGKAQEKGGCCGGKCSGGGCGGGKCGSGKCGEKCGGKCGCGQKQEQQAQEAAQAQAQAQAMAQAQGQAPPCQCPSCQLRRIRESGCTCERCQLLQQQLIHILQHQAPQQNVPNPMVPPQQQNDVEKNEVEEEDVEECEEEEVEAYSQESDYEKYCVDNKKED